MKMIKALQCIERYWFTLSIFILLMITTLSLWPLDYLPLVPGSDKTNHLLAYAALVFPTALRKPNRWMLLVVFFVFSSKFV